MSTLFNCRVNRSWTGLSWLRIGTGGGHLRARYLTVGLTVPGSGMWGMDWIEMAQDRDNWWTLVSTVFNCRINRSKEWGCGVWTGLRWLRIGTIGGHL